MEREIHVAAGVLMDGRGRVLIARRHLDTHQGGLWEFPGGKMQPGEDPETALARELHEELGVSIRIFRPLIRIAHSYPERSVVLHVFLVSDWEGEPEGLEGQPLAWEEPRRLRDYPMPAADHPILAALRLPARYVITPPNIDDPQRFLVQLDGLLQQGVRLIQFRVFGPGPKDLAGLYREVDARCRAADATLLCNAPERAAHELGATGLHLNSRSLRSCETRPQDFEWVGASCHCADDLRRAEYLGVDFAVLSPVLPTRSHPDAEPLRWEGFARLAADARIPVYALGGMHADMLERSWRAGAQGIAGIRGFWGDAAI
jgi:8-oxo-dGTP diphosphatase